MTVRCQLLVLLLLVSSVVSGPTRSAAESPDGSSSAPAPEVPSEAMTSQQPETPAPVQEPPLIPTQATLAPVPSPPETATKTGPEVVAKISLTESSSSAMIAPASLAPETASSASVEISAKQTSPEDPATTEPERCAEPAVGDADGSANETCGSSGLKDTEGGSTNNSCIVDDREYPDGARVSGRQDPCRPCFCHRKRVTCVELRCYTRRGCKPLFKAGVCCPTYDHCPPVPLVNASGEIEQTADIPEDTTGADSLTTDQLTDESVAHLVDSSAHSQDDSEDESTSDHDQDDDDGDDHDHSHRHHKQHHMLDTVSPLTSSATTLHPATSFPFLVRGRTGVEVR